MNTDDITYVDKFKKSLKVFVSKVSNEADETKESAYIIGKYLKGETVTEEDDKKLKEQVFDMFKIIGIGIPFVLIPGASILLPIIISLSKKMKINLMPSSFKE